MELDEVDNKLTNTAKNRNVRALQNKQKKEITKIKDELQNLIKEAFERINDESEEYFEELLTTESERRRAEREFLRKKRKATYDFVVQKYGFQKKDSMIIDMLDDGEVYRKSRLIIMRGVFQQKSRFEVREQLKKFFLIDKQFNRHYSRAIQDINAQFDRSLHYAKAIEMGYNAAIYEGGLIETSREFCQVRNSKVFTLEEINKFGTSKDKFGGYSNKDEGQFKGKMPGYLPLIDAGGYNCRHFYSFISDSLAEVIRPELKK